ncbi:hypothetical protein BE20_16030 [Sorangium cellulosum]|uniref:Secreted protein n=1 Tax=Sorangium cellulosum TaxID=56 RepID=A0A150S466_SORCE|nr:hypothetical protein BE18_39750 [Sorangium cellulosum]KYF91001.1 hypothetical protein BE20_16030 [Sorangium cellulosum]
MNDADKSPKVIVASSFPMQARVATRRSTLAALAASILVPGNARADAPAPTLSSTPAIVLPDRPSPLDDFTNDQVQFTAYSLKQAAALDVPFFGSKYSGSQQLVAYEWKRWVDRKTKSGSVEHVGVAVQLFLRVRKLDANARTSSLSFLAASATLGHAQVDAHIRVRGASSAAISMALPGPSTTTFNVESFQTWLDAVNKIKALILRPETHINPVVLIEPKTSRDVDPLLEHAVVAYGLAKIADGETLAEALDDLPETSDREARRALVIDLYLDFAGIESTELDREPSDHVVQRAKRYVDEMVNDA